MTARVEQLYVLSSSEHYRTEGLAKMWLADSEFRILNLEFRIRVTDFRGIKLDLYLNL